MFVIGFFPTFREICPVKPDVLLTLGKMIWIEYIHVPNMDGCSALSRSDLTTIDNLCSVINRYSRTSCVQRVVCWFLFSDGWSTLSRSFSFRIIFAFISPFHQPGINKHHVPSSTPEKQEPTSQINDSNSSLDPDPDPELLPKCIKRSTFFFPL